MNFQQKRSKTKKTQPISYEEALKRRQRPIEHKQVLQVNEKLNTHHFTIIFLVENISAKPHRLQQ